MIKTVLCLLLILSNTLSQRCLGMNGEEVIWWTALKVPPKINKSGYAYYDSSMHTGRYLYN